MMAMGPVSHIRKYRVFFVGLELRRNHQHGSSCARGNWTISNATNEKNKYKFIYHWKHNHSNPNRGNANVLSYRSQTLNEFILRMRRFKNCYPFITIIFSTYLLFWLTFTLGVKSKPFISSTKNIFNTMMAINGATWVEISKISTTVSLICSWK